MLLSCLSTRNVPGKTTGLVVRILISNTRYSSVAYIRSPRRYVRRMALESESKTNQPIKAPVTTTCRKPFQTGDSQISLWGGLVSTSEPKAGHPLSRRRRQVEAKTTTVWVSMPPQEIDGIGNASMATKRRTACFVRELDEIEVGHMEWLWVGRKVELVM